MFHADPLSSPQPKQLESKKAGVWLPVSKKLRRCVSNKRLPNPCQCFKICIYFLHFKTFKYAKRHERWIKERENYAEVKLKIWHFKLACLYTFCACIDKAIFSTNGSVINYIFLSPPSYKPLLVRPVLSSGHPWVRSVITGVVTAEPLGSTTDWVPPGRSRHVSRFPGPKCHCVCVCVCVCPHQPLCFLSAMHGKWKTLCRDILWSRGSPCHWLVTSLTCTASPFLQHRASLWWEVSERHELFILSESLRNNLSILGHYFWMFKMLMT